MKRLSHSVAESISYLVWDLGRLLKRYSGCYTNLETGSEDELSLVAQDGSVMSMIVVEGLLEVPDESRYRRINQALFETLGVRMEGAGHHLQVTFQYDPNGLSDLNQSISPLYKAVDQMGMGSVTHTLIKDWEEYLGQYVGTELTTICVWTTPEVLNKKEETDSKKEQRVRARKEPWRLDAQAIELEAEAIVHTHNAFIKNIASNLQGVGILCRVFNTHRNANLIRRSLFAGETNRAWTPLLPGDPTAPSGYSDNQLVTESPEGSVLFPSLSEQLSPCAALYDDKNNVSLGGRTFSPVAMTLAPNNPQAFNIFFRRMVSKAIPWALSFHIDSGARGNSWWGFKRGLTSIIRLGSPDSKRIYKSLSRHKELAESGNMPYVNLQVCATTWVDDGDTKTLQARRSDLLDTMQGWGNCDVVPTYDDPAFCVYSAFPGWTRQCPAPVAFAPLSDVLTLLPFMRPAVPWKNGTMPFRSPDGKVLPYQQGSSLQSHWVELSSAPMGFGKSVQLAMMNLAFCLQSGYENLPYLSIMDVGPSSEPLIKILEDQLPAQKKHHVLFKRLRMVAEDSVNPCDTPVGARKPMPAHRFFLINFFTLLGTPVGRDKPYDDLDQIATACIDLAYDEYSDDRSPKRYQEGRDLEIDQALEKINFGPDQATTWWEIVDTLFDHGQHHMAAIAQRYAVPLVKEIAAMAKREQIAGTYTDVINGTFITDLFHRSITSSISQYPIIKDVSRLNFSDARVLALDLDEVTPKSQQPAAVRQTEVMMMLGRHITAARFFEMPRDVEELPTRFKRYHADRIDEIRVRPKRLCWDEFHRVSTNPSIATQVVADVETAIRESRKWNLHIALSSQSISDFPGHIIKLASTILILGAGDGEWEVVTKTLNLNEAAANVARNIRPPGPGGATMLGVFRTTKGRVVQPLMSTIGPMLRMANSTVTEDKALRDKLAAVLGFTPAVLAIAKHYPDGAKNRVAELNQMIAELGLEEEHLDAYGRLVREIVDAGQVRQEVA